MSDSEKRPGIFGRLRRALVGNSDQRADEKVEPTESMMERASLDTVDAAEPALSPQEVTARQRWQKAMPICLIEFYEPMMADLDTLDFNSIRRCLWDEYRDSSRVALDLLAWYGQGAGDWERYPQYETAAEQLLMEQPIGLLLAALEDFPLDDAHLEGAARLFAGDLFTGLRAADLIAIPAGIRMALREHVTHSEDPHKVERINRIFPESI